MEGQYCNVSYLGSPLCHTIFVARNGIDGSESIRGLTHHPGSKKEKQSLNLFFDVTRKAGKYNIILKTSYTDM
jgi:hypothetical protein